ncbi:MAG TPA: DUF4388 domain-containing protein [Planktothrix sp.]
MLSKSLENRGTSLEICWSPADTDNEFSLTVQASPRGGDCDWRMFAGLGQRARPLWHYTSCDVLLVYNLIVSSCGGGGLPPGGLPTPEFGTPVERPFYKLDSVRTSEEMSPLKTSLPGDGAAMARGGSALTGDLAHVQMPTLLQSILMAKMTGRLKIESSDREAEVYFQGGIPVHAMATDTLGEESIFELLTWKDGNFYFEPGATTDAHTIKQPLDTLLLQGMQLIDNAAYLRNKGLRPEALIARKHQNLSEPDFEAMVKSGMPLNMTAQKQFYKAIVETETIQQLLEKLRLPRSMWIQLMCNLLRTDLISIEQPRAGKRDKPPLEPKGIDKRAIMNIMMSLRSPETGMFTYPAFLYFLEQEYFRAYRSASPISVVVFQMRIYSANLDPVREPLPLSALSEAVRRISRVKRHVDLLAHYEAYDYALLLPNTKTGGAQIFANRLVKALMSEPLIPGVVDGSNLQVAFGIASIPEDFLDLSLLLSAAEVAKNAAVHGAGPVALYRDIK